MSHFERELFFEQMKYWKMLDHLQADVILRIHYCRGTQMDLPDGIVPHVPKNVRRSVFNDIPPIQDWWVFHLNNGHWLIRTQACAISAKDWDVAFIQWSIAWYICKKISGKCWHSPTSKFIVWWRRDDAAEQWNRPRYEQGKVLLDQWQLSMAFHNPCRRADSTIPPIVKILRKK